MTQIVSRDKNGVVVKTIKRSTSSDGHNPSSAWATEDPTVNTDMRTEEEIEYYDEIVICCL